MEEDIKILEEFIKEYDRDANIRRYVGYYTIKSIINLIYRNKKYENKIKAVLELIDTKPYTAYTLYGDILYDDENIRELLEEGDK